MRFKSRGGTATVVVTAATGLVFSSSYTQVLAFVAPLQRAPIGTWDTARSRAEGNTCPAVGGRAHHSRRLGYHSRRTVRMCLAEQGDSDAETSRDDSNMTGEDELLPVVAMREGVGTGVDGRAVSERPWGTALRRTLRRGAASLAAITLGTTALSGLSAGLQGKVGRAIPGAMATARASILKPFHKRTVNEKLASVPAFMVTNLKGSPYLTPSMVPGEQLAVFFTNYADAEEMLRQMVQNKFYAREARVLIVSLEKAYTMVRQGPRGTGYANDAGQEEFMTFKFERDSSSFPKARRLGLKLDRSAYSIDIPIFYAEGLEVKKDGGMVKPLFIDPEDLVEAWKKAKDRNPEMPDKPPVKVFSLPEVIIQMEVSDELKDFGFFGSTEVSDLITGARACTGGQRLKPRLGRLQPY